MATDDVSILKAERVDDATASTAAARAGSEPRETAEKLSCAEVRGGNGSIFAPVVLPGIKGTIYSQPADDGGGGGDVYYLSVCGSGVLARFCVADVAGHGETVSAVSDEMYRMLRRFSSWPSQARLLRALNRSLYRRGLNAMTTAAAMTYDALSQKLSYSYAGHPPAWHYSAKAGRWRRLRGDEESKRKAKGFVDGALAVVSEARFTSRSLKMAPGDRVVVITDGVLEAPGAEKELFGDARIDDLLEAQRALPTDALAGSILDHLRLHSGDDALTHDDITLLVLEFVPGPGGPALWHVVRNRLLRKLGLVGEPDLVAM
jgi:sigma-B regulation protein RsbU (phosphoserine phosphatase)